MTGDLTTLRTRRNMGAGGRWRWLPVMAVMAVVPLACRFEVTPKGDVSLTIANRTFSFNLLDVLDPFQITANGVPVAQAARITLFTQQPVDVPQSAVLTLSASKVQAIALDSARVQPLQQSVTGLVFIAVSIGAGTATTCDNVTVGTFTLDVTGNQVSVRNPSLTVPPAALAMVRTGDFSICLRVSATITVTIIIDELGISFGDPVEDPGDGDGDGGVTPPVGSTVYVPINSGGAAVTADRNLGGIDYAAVGVLEASSPDAPAGPGPSSLSVNLADLGLASVGKVHMALHSSYVPDVANGAKVAELVFEYAQGGPPTTRSLVLGSNTAEWSYGRPEHTAIFGGVQHALPPVLYSFTSTVDSASTYVAHEYAETVTLDPMRTLSCIRLILADPATYAGLRSPISPAPTWAQQSVIAMTLEGTVGTPAVTVSVPCGAVVECLVNTDCAGNQVCVSHTCVAAPGGCVTNGDCAIGEQCVGGQCVVAPECVVDSNCPAGEHCIGNQCVPVITPDCTVDADCAAGEHCVGGECVTQPGSGFTSAVILHRGSEQIVAGPDIDPASGLAHSSDFTVSALVFDSFNDSLALSGDGSTVWFRLRAPFPQPGVPPVQLWSINVDGTGAQQSPLPGTIATATLHLRSSTNGSVCIAHDAAGKFYRATRGQTAQVAFDYSGQNYDIRTGFDINGNAGRMVFLDRAASRVFTSDLTVTPATATLLLAPADMALSGVLPQNVPSYFVVDLSDNASGYVFRQNYFSSTLLDPTNQDVFFHGQGFASPALTMIQVRPISHTVRDLNVTDDGQTVGYCFDPPGIDTPNECRVESVNGSSVLTLGDDRTKVGAFTLSDDGSRAYYRTSICCGGGKGILQDVGGGRVPAGTQVLGGTGWVQVVQLSDDGRTLAAPGGLGVYVLRDNVQPFAGFPTIDGVSYRLDTDGDDCKLVVRVVARSPRGIQRIFVNPYIDGVDPTDFIPNAENPLYHERHGGGVNMNTTFTLIDAANDVWERQIPLTNGLGQCAAQFLSADYRLRIIVVDINGSMTVFQDFAPGS